MTAVKLIAEIARLRLLVAHLERRILYLERALDECRHIRRAA